MTEYEKGRYSAFNDIMPVLLDIVDNFLHSIRVNVYSEDIAELEKEWCKLTGKDLEESGIYEAIAEYENRNL